MSIIPPRATLFERPTQLIDAIESSSVTSPNSAHLPSRQATPRGHLPVSVRGGFRAPVRDTFGGRKQVSHVYDSRGYSGSDVVRRLRDVQERGPADPPAVALC